MGCGLMIKEEFGIREFHALNEDWEDYRDNHMDYVLESGRTYRTWTEVGGNSKLIYELYGRWHVSKSAGDTFAMGFDYFEDYFWAYINENITPMAEAISEYLAESGGMELVHNLERFITYMTGKVMKSISYGATWKQMESYISKAAEGGTEYR